MEYKISNALKLYVSLLLCVEKEPKIYVIIVIRVAFSCYNENYT